MYAVVGCGECGALWVVEGRPETTGCPQCRTRHRFERLRRFAETDDAEAARAARAAALAERAGVDEDLAFGTMGERAAEAGIDDREYLERTGVDPDATAAAGERRAGGVGGSPSRRDVVLAALRELDRPTEDEVVGYADERGVPAEYVREALAKLVRDGDASESRGRYRLV